MKFNIYILFIFLVLHSCGKTITNIPIENKNSIKVESLNGKWTGGSTSTKVYFEEELEKVVLTDGCQVVSANYKRFEPAISFSNITKTNSTCELNQIDLGDILKQTVIIKSIDQHKIGFYNEGNNALLILNKN